MIKSETIELFKYISVTPDSKNSDVGKNLKDQQRLKQIIVDHKVFYSKPSRLNDVFECKPHFLQPKTNKAKKKIAQYGINKFLKNKPRADRRRAEKLYLKQDFSKKFEFLQKSFWEFLNGYGLFCLTNNSKSPIMWSHYSNLYQGLCIGFTVNKIFDQDFGMMESIAYQSEYPVIDLLDILNFEDSKDPFPILKSILYTKSTEWDYEEEYRFAKPPESGGSCLYKIDPKKITEIIIGPKMKDKERKMVLGLVEEGLNETKVYSSKISNKRYSIDKDQQIN